MKYHAVEGLEKENSISIIKFQVSINPLVCKMSISFS